ncbi:glycosyltransferase [Amycolatopsis sp. NPDC054798]
MSVIIPAHNEAETVAEVVADAQRGLEYLQVERYEVVVSASGCTDDTAAVALKAGARVVDAPIGKGAAIQAGLAATNGEVVCLIDGDIRYYGDVPLSAILVKPIIDGIADACVSDLYWRPLYPQLWLYGFFAPVAGVLFPEILPKVGSTPWSGQRAAKRDLWPTNLETDFTVDLQLLLHWNDNTPLLRPVLADDWVNPQRPKPDLMEKELSVLTRHAMSDGRISRKDAIAIGWWFKSAHSLMAQYRPDEDDPQEFEHRLLRNSVRELHAQLRAVAADTP